MSPLLAAAAALALSAPGECGLPPLRAGPLPFRPGETLRFDIEVMGIVKAGTLSLSVERPAFAGSEIPLKARIRNTSVFAKVRQVTGIAMSWADARTLRPERYVDETLENGVKKSSDTRIRADASEVTIASRFGGRQETLTAARQGEVLDALSFVYFLRAADLKPRQELCLDLVANRRYWRVRASVAPGTDRVDSGAGAFETIRIDGVAARADNPEAKRPIHFWISRDSQHLPVAAVSEIDLGPVRLMLSRVTAP